MEKDLEKFINSIKQIKLTSGEKFAIRSKISFAAQIPAIARPSPYASFFDLMHLKRALVLAAVVLLVGGGSLSYASKSALPGDLLYSVKHMNEEVKGVFARTPEAKLAVLDERIQARVEEAKSLGASGRLTPERQRIIKNNLDLEIVNAIALTQDPGMETSEAVSRIISHIEEGQRIIVENEMKMEEGLIEENQGVLEPVLEPAQPDEALLEEVSEEVSPEKIIAPSPAPAEEASQLRE